MFNRPTQFQFVLVLSLVMLSTSAFSAGVDDTTLEVSGAYRSFKGLAYSVAAICACIGGAKVYSKIAQGDPAYKSVLVSWFMAMLACAFIPSILDGLFKPGGDLHTELGRTNSLIRGSWDSYTSILKIVLALATVMGSIRVYSIWQSGHDVYQAVLYWFGAIVFGALVISFLESGVFGSL